MILLDTDHLSVLADRSHSQHPALRARIESSADTQMSTTIISVEEQLRGWMAFLARSRELRKQLPAYARLVGFIEFLRRWTPVAMTELAVGQFEQLRREGVRIGTQDLKIASIALVHGATVLSANLRDFRQVPGLRVENWLS